MIRPNKTANIFETLGSENTADKSNQPLAELQFLKWPMWLLGPLLLLSTGMVTTLWLTISSIFLSPNIASLLSLIGFDSIFNLGATLFLRMADSCSRPNKSTQNCNSKPLFRYQFWNMVLSVLTEILTWHWQSPMWLATPVVYESYCVLQLMRGLKLGAELSAPAWMMHNIRGLVRGGC
ncbi:hypothetical protein QYF36_009964 [Acer negundo]|nr:hypothetical protein QYF36_009964 [Acer negundo]